MKPLMQQDIDRYKNDIKQNHIQGVVRTYSDLLSKGYNYAGWAKGVAEAEGMTWSSLPKGETTGSGSGDVYEGFFGTNIYRTEIEQGKVRYK